MLGSTRLRAYALVVATAAALMFAVPVWAHGGKERGATFQAPATEASEPASQPEISSVEMAWPTTVEEGGGMGMRHEQPKTLPGRILAWLGGWHPAIVHFPIALFLTAAFLEAAAAVRRKSQYKAGVGMLLGLAAVSAFAAALLGWANAGLPTTEDELFLTAHRWLGVALPFLMLLVWRLKPKADAARGRKGYPFYEATLIAVTLAVLAQAYLGGDITHGADHLDF